MSKVLKALSIIKFMTRAEKPVYTAENPNSCPYCGQFDCSMQDETQMFHGEYVETWYVECSVCFARSPFSTTVKLAWEMWNKRGQHHPLCPQEH